MSNLIFGGMIPCSRASTDLMRLVSPDAPSEWPKFGLTCLDQSLLNPLHISISPCILTEPMKTPLSPKTLPMALTSIGSPVGVPVP